MEIGDLVWHGNSHRFGIIVSGQGMDTEVVFGDGAREITPVWQLYNIPAGLKVDCHANFKEMAEAYTERRGFS